MFVNPFQELAAEIKIMLIGYPCSQALILRILQYGKVQPKMVRALFIEYIHAILSIFFAWFVHMWFSEGVQDE